MRGDGVDEDVDGDCPLPMRGALVMMMAMISPSQREVSLAEQPRQSPRLVPPRGGGVSSQKLASDFFSDERLHIAEDGHRRATRGPTRYGARPHPRGWWVAPLCAFFAQYLLYNPKPTSVEFQDFWSCAE